MLDEKIATRTAFSSLCAHVPSSKLNYLAALYLFDDLEIIKFNGDYLSLTECGILLAKMSDCNRVLNIGKIAVQRVINDKLLSCEKITYSLESDSIEMPINAFSLSAAVYRNFLITINVLHLKNNRLFVTKEYEECFESFCTKAVKRMSQDDLLKRLEKQRVDGESGELFVLDYENKKLFMSGKKAKRISQIDVAAGYDIISFQNQSSKEYDCFIEVKAYRGTPHFFWSANERNTSMLLKEKYQLFLVNLDKIADEGYKPIIITDPYNSLSQEGWLIEPQTYHIVMI